MIPRLWRAVRAAGYALTAVGGSFALVIPPDRLVDLSAYATVAWGILTTFPALAALAGVLLRRPSWEQVAVWPLAGGLAVYAILAIGSAGSAGFSRAAFTLALAMVLISHGLQIAADTEREVALARARGCLDG